jgi:hypothetical protein
MNPIRISTLGLLEDRATFFDRRNIGYITVVGNSKVRRETDPLSRDFNSTVRDGFSPHDTKSKESAEN